MPYLVEVAGEFHPGPGAGAGPDGLFEIGTAKDSAADGAVGNEQLALVAREIEDLHAGYLHHG
jgi:hypothetical protein